MARTERLAQLRQNLVEHFDLEELRTLCFDHSVDYDALSGEGKEAKARELDSYLERLRPFDISPRTTCNLTAHVCYTSSMIYTWGATS